MWPRCFRRFHFPLAAAPRIIVPKAWKLLHLFRANVCAAFRAPLVTAFLRLYPLSLCELHAKPPLDVERLGGVLVHGGTERYAHKGFQVLPWFLASSF